jgi:biotin synthase-like enzyme|tara:strand:- start:342 stop:638 length:297 start_codon:yes stop_codon:yes gene_type:complete
MADKKTEAKTPRQRWKTDATSNVKTIIRALRRIGAWEYSSETKAGARGVKYTEDELDEIARAVRSELNAAMRALKAGMTESQEAEVLFGFGTTHAKKK